MKFRKANDCWDMLVSKHASEIPEWSLELGSNGRPPWPRGFICPIEFRNGSKADGNAGGPSRSFDLKSWKWCRRVSAGNASEAAAGAVAYSATLGLLVRSSVDCSSGREFRRRSKAGESRGATLWELGSSSLNLAHPRP